MIDVAVGQPDFVDRDASLSDGTLDVRQIAAGINDYGMLRGLAPQQGAVLLEGRNRNDDGLGFGHGPCAPERKGLLGRIVARACSSRHARRYPYRPGIQPQTRRTRRRVTSPAVIMDSGLAGLKPRTRNDALRQPRP